jgi:hypothetical protein
MGLFNRFERALGRYALPNLAMYLIGGQIAFFGFSLLGHFDVRRIMLWPALVLEGEWWRLFTFVLVPPASGQLTMTAALFLALSWYFFYMISQALESYWGVVRFNLFFLLGWVLTVGVSFVTPAYPTTYAFFAISVFLAFAFLNPDFELYLFFILPVKIKWFALLLWLSFAYSFVVGDWNIRLTVLAATGNFLVFFARDIVQRIRSGRRHMQQQVRRASFKQDRDEPRHRCVVCGKTDLTHPQMDFRYCSKCAHDECYCADHIFNHEHSVAEKK